MAHSKQTSGEDTDQVMARFNRVLLLGSILFIVPIVILGIYLDWRFRSVDRKLKYVPPDQRFEGQQVIETLPWDPIVGQTVYVPAYSHIYHHDGRPQLLTVTLSIRNTDQSNSIVVTKIDYFNSTGEKIKSYAPRRVQISPMGSTEIVVEQEDASGGSGASFLVQWIAGHPVEHPVIEAVMIGSDNLPGISFTRSGHIIEEEKAPVDLADD